MTEFIKVSIFFFHELDGIITCLLDWSSKPTLSSFDTCPARDERLSARVQQTVHHYFTIARLIYTLNIFMIIFMHHLCPMRMKGVHLVNL